jgi:hypothetical protein
MVSSACSKEKKNKSKYFSMLFAIN